MDAPTILRVGFTDFHAELLEDVAGVERDELFWQPAAGINHIGFLLWHLIRDEDTVISQSVLRQGELWRSERWFEALGLDTDDQGTGFDSSGLESFRFELPGLLRYAQRVWQQTENALAAMDAGRLNEHLEWSGTWNLANLLTTGCLAHGWVHLGEIRQLRGIRGWKFRE